MGRYNTTVCDDSVFELGRHHWWWGFLVSEMLQFGILLWMNCMHKTLGAGGVVASVSPICCFLCPSISFIVGAAAFSPIFAKFLFVPFFAAVFAEWTAACILPPLLSLPIFCMHRRQFVRMFPGAKNLDDFISNEEMDVGCTAEDLAGGFGSWFLSFFEWGLWGWDWFSKYA